MEKEPAAMLRGDQITLWPVREEDLKCLYEMLRDLTNRGAFESCPVGDPHQERGIPSRG
jgi:hypothetical protein